MGMAYKGNKSGLQLSGNITMKTQVSQLLKSPMGTTQSFIINVNAKPIIDDVVFNGLLVGQAKFTRTNRGILVETQLTTSVQLPCSRCLEELTCPLQLNFQEEFWPIVDITTGLPLQQPDVEQMFVIDEDHTLDLTEAVRQYTLLSLPMQPLCRSDCAGLCITCGKNLNLGPCTCPVTAKNNRLTTVASLLDASEVEGI
jgi:uncharacterized protein